MKHYKTPTNEIMAIGEVGDIDGDQSLLVQPDWTLLTDAEYQTLITPAPIQVTSITKVQAMRYLKSINKWNDFQTIISSNTDAKDEWDLALSLDLNDPFTQSLAPALGIDLNTAFNEASNL